MQNYGAEMIKYAVFDESTAATHEAVAAVAGKKIRVVFLHLQSADAAQLATLKSGATGLTGAMDLQSGPITWPRDERGWGETAAAAALNITVSQAVQVGGVIGDVEV